MLASPMCVLFSGNPAYDHYSMKLASIDGFDGKMAAFNLTLLVGSRRWFVKNCFSHGQVTVSYAGVPMGEGRVCGGGFCAEPRSEEAEVSAVARGRQGGHRAAARQPEEAHGGRAAVGGRGVRRRSQAVPQRRRHARLRHALVQGWIVARAAAVFAMSGLH